MSIIKEDFDKLSFPEKLNLMKRFIFRKDKIQYARIYDSCEHIIIYVVKFDDSIFFIRDMLDKKEEIPNAEIHFLSRLNKPGEFVTFMGCMVEED